MRISILQVVKTLFKRPWIVTQEWHDVLFLHWSVSPDVVRQHIPSELILDVFDNRAWISLVFFEVKGNRPRFIPPIPGANSFLELNFRTYVTYKGRAGVHFFSLDVNNPMIVKMATLGNLMPFNRAKMHFKKHKRKMTIQSSRVNKSTLFETLFTSFEPIPQTTKPTQLALWLTERYHLWTKPNDELFRIDMHHSPWKLQNVTVTIHENTMGSFLNSDYQDKPPIVHYSKMKKAYAFPPVLEGE